MESCDKYHKEICVDFEAIVSTAVDKKRFTHAALRNINNMLGTFWEGLLVHVRVISNPIVPLTLGERGEGDIQPKSAAVYFGGEEVCT